MKYQNFTTTTRQSLALHAQYFYCRHMNGDHRASNVEAELCGGTISNKMCEEAMVVGG